MGKGSSPRPFSVDQQTFESNWDRVFGKKSQEVPEWDHYSDLPAPRHYNDQQSQKDTKTCNG